MTGSQGGQQRKGRGADLREEAPRSTASSTSSTIERSGISNTGRYLRVDGCWPTDKAFVTLSKHIEEGIVARSSQVKDQLGYELRVTDWQIAAATMFRSGRDLLIVTSTGSGKSFCFQSPLFLLEGKAILVVCGLVTLMNDQVEAAKRLGIKAVALHAAQRKADPELVGRVANGEYELVFVTPEFCDASEADFMRLARRCEFSRRLMGVVVDEVQLSYCWANFRPRYSRLHTLRYHFKKAPFMALSATLTPAMRTYVHSSLRFISNTAFIHRSIDRPNIYICTRRIQHTLASRKDIEFVLDAVNLDDINSIPSTIIFIDSRKEACELCTQLWRKLPLPWRLKHPWAICDLSTILSDERRSGAMAAMRLGLCRILISTQITEVGIDFPDVKRVIQWRVPATLSGTGLYQRFGRAARKSNSEAVAILFYAGSQEAPSDDDTHPLAIYREPPSSKRLRDILALIQAWDSGNKFDARDLRTDLGDYGSATLERSQRLDPTPDIPEQYDGALRAILRRDTEMEQGDSPHTTIGDLDKLEQASQDYTGDKVDGEEESGYLEPEVEIEALGRLTAISPKRAKTSRTIPAVSRLILWLINTTGCLREVFLRYLDEVDFGLGTQITYPCGCCDRHNTPPPDHIKRLLPKYVAKPGRHGTASENQEQQTQEGAESDGGEPDVASTSSRFNTPQEVSLEIANHLRDLRVEVARERGLDGLHCPYPAYKIITDEQIKYISRNAAKYSKGNLPIQKLLTTSKLVPEDRNPLTSIQDRIAESITTGWNASKRPGAARPPPRRTETQPSQVPPATGELNLQSNTTLAHSGGPPVPTTRPVMPKRSRGRPSEKSKAKRRLIQLQIEAYDRATGNHSPDS